MNKRSTWIRGTFAAAFIIIAGFSACKKNDTDVKTENGPGSRADSTRDSIFFYAKEVYLWNNELPTYDAFDPRSYTTLGSDIDNYYRELYDITRYGINPATSKPYEENPNEPGYPKYSYISDLNDRNPVAVIRPKSSVNTDGVGYDIGIYSFSAFGTDREYKLFIKAVYPGSPAAAEGLTRGTQITAIEGKNIGSNFNNEKDLINSLLDSSTPSAKLKGLRTDGSAFELTLERDSYNSSPVYKSKIFEANGKKVGYINLGRFSQLSNPEGENTSDKNLDPVFAQFASAGLTDLIVDLRYNGGGYVSTAEHLINLIAPASATGVMYKEVYNETMQQRKATILKNQPLTDANGNIRYGTDNKMLTYFNVDYTVEGNTATFKKKGSLNGVKRVVFIVTGSTASASELTINALKPFVDVKLVGTTTYGKPVGFFPVTIENRYDVYFSMFETKNAKDEGGYYAGMKPDVSDAIDDSKRDFDDPRENYIAKALEILAPGTATNARASMSVKGSSGATLSLAPALNEKIKTPNQFIGMIETRHRTR